VIELTCIRFDALQGLLCTQYRCRRLIERGEEQGWQRVGRAAPPLLRNSTVVRRILVACADAATQQSLGSARLLVVYSVAAYLWSQHWQPDRNQLPQLRIEKVVDTNRSNLWSHRSGAQQVQIQSLSHMR
jgi:hypothetical protein